MSNTNTLRKRVGRLIRNFRRDERGVSAVEFAVVAPFFIALWGGMTILLDTENTTTKVGKVTATVADIIAQAPNANSEYINAAFDAGKAMMGNIAEGKLKLYVAGIEINNDQTIDVKWVCGRHFTEDEMDSAVDAIDLPAQLKQTAGFVVASYGEYSHTPVYLGGKEGSDHTYVYRNYFVPRVSLETLNDGCDG